MPNTIFCKKCNLSIFEDEKYVICIVCDDYFHAFKEKNCAGLSPTEERVISLSTIQPKLMYRCDRCSTLKISTLLNNTDRFAQVIDNFNTSINNLSVVTNSLQEATDKINKIEDSQKKFLEDKLPIIEKRINNLENSSDSVNNNNKHQYMQEIVSEIYQQKQLEKNVMIFNFKDNSNKSNDLKNIKDLLTKNKIKINNISIIRLGKFTDNKNRPIKISFKSKEEAFRMLTSSFKIVKSSEQKIFITNDKTKNQLQLEKDVKAEFFDRKNNGDTNIKIKYINSIPTIIEVEPSVADSESDNEVLNGTSSPQNSSLSNSDMYSAKDSEEESSNEIDEIKSDKKEKKKINIDKSAKTDKNLKNLKNLKNHSNNDTTQTSSSDNNHHHSKKSSSKNLQVINSRKSQKV